jgi:1,4-dihydroxy-2-naphthoate octaprenyltransferase
MTIGGSLCLIAAGAILKWAVTAHVNGVDLQTVGTVLFVIGLIGLVLACVYTFGPRARTAGPVDPVDPRFER